MSIKDLELLHGAVLTKLVRSDNPITLRMIETNRNEARSAYTLNDEVILYIKYHKKPGKRGSTIHLDVQLSGATLAPTSRACQGQAKGYLFSTRLRSNEYCR